MIYQMEGVAHQTNRFTKDTREDLKDLDSRAEAVGQFPIDVTIFLKSLLPLLE